MKTTDFYYIDIYDVLRIETSENNAENLSLWFGNSFNENLFDDFQKREREKGGREGEKKGNVSNMFLVLSLFCRRNSSLKPLK